MVTTGKQKKKSNFLKQQMRQIQIAEKQCVSIKAYI